jgi:hypothetical protein
MQEGNKSLTQSEMLAQELLKIAPDVTAADRALYIDEKGSSKATLSNYLNGTVLDNDTAAMMIAFFKERIRLRYTVAQINQD